MITYIRKATVLCFLLSLCAVRGTVWAQDAELKWVEGIGNARWATYLTPSFTDFQLDGEGNIYVIGHFDSGNTWLDHTDVDPVHFPCIMSSSYHGIYVAKLDSNDHRIWIKSLRTSLKSDMNDGAYIYLSDLKLQDSLLYFNINLVGQVQNGYQMCIPPFIWFFDTLYTFPVIPDNPYEGSNYLLPDSLLHFPFNYYTGASFTAFITMDLNGNMIDRHLMEQNYIYTYRGQTHFGYPSANSIPGAIDSHKNNHIFQMVSEGDYTIFDNDSTKRLYVPFIDSANNVQHKIQPSGPLTFVHNNDSISLITHTTVDSNFNITSSKPFISHVDNPQVFYHTATKNLILCLIGSVNFSGQNLTVDNEDNVYLRATIQVYTKGTTEIAAMGITYRDSNGVYIPFHKPAPVDYPYHIFLDSVHYITVENYQASNCIPIIIKYDSQGNILWCNQLYADRQDSVALVELDCIPSVAVDSDYVYVPWHVGNCWTLKQDLGINIRDSANWWEIPQDTIFPKDYYFDEEHRHRYDAPQLDAPPPSQLMTPENVINLRNIYSRDIIAVYDRETGEFIRYFDPLRMATSYYDSINKNTMNEFNGNPYLANRLLLQDGKLYMRLLVINSLINPQIFHYKLLQYDTRTDECVIIDSSMHAGGNAHYMGLDGRYYFSTYYESISRYTPHSPVMDILSNSYNLTDASPILGCYYLPNCDTRRLPPCPPVDSLAATRTAPASFHLDWLPDPAHSAWHVARLPASDPLPDSAAWESAPVTETAYPSLALDIDSCTLLRVRGICSPDNYGPWSQSVMLCPAVGTDHPDVSPHLAFVPNPASGPVTVVDSRSGSPLHFVKEIQVISPLGQTLLRSLGSARFNVADLPAATYLVKVVTHHTTHLLKLVVE